MNINSINQLEQHTVKLR